MFRQTILALAALLASLTLTAPPSGAQTVFPEEAELEASADATLARLYATNPVARDLSANAKGILVFPRIYKGGLIIGAATGIGVLRVDARTTATYQSVAFSYGLQAGVSRFGYVAMFLDQRSLDFLDDSAGWEIGIAPEVVIADEGFAKRFSTTTARDGVVVFFVDQAGFFAGASIEGTKITRLPD